MAVSGARIGALPGLTEANRRWWTLAGSCMGLFVLMLDSTVINIALPDIARDLDATTAGLQWVMNAYLLMLAAFVITMARLGDILGRRRLFLIGMAVFAGGSAVAATSGSEQVLVAGRVLQGLGGAALLGLSLAIVSAVFDAGERARALGIWAGVSALALAWVPCWAAPLSTRSAGVGCSGLICPSACSAWCSCWHRPPSSVTKLLRDASTSPA